jgi:hypothetical protein
MRRPFVIWTLALAIGAVGTAGAFRLFHQSSTKRENSEQSNPGTKLQALKSRELADASFNPEPPPPQLPETSPPPGLPIVPWGKRDHFPVVRNPKYLTAEQGDHALARDEPILGLVLGSEARAYSTNQLNEHEMVIDTLAGTPILVTY